MDQRIIKEIDEVLTDKLRGLFHEMFELKEDETFIFWFIVISEDPAYSLYEVDRVLKDDASDIVASLTEPTGKRNRFNVVFEHDHQEVHVMLILYKPVFVIWMQKPLLIPICYHFRDTFEDLLAD